MKPLKLMACMWGLFLGVKMQAQQPVKYELTKVAETIVVPPSTPADAYEKCQVDGKIDDSKLFGSFYQRIEMIGKEVNNLTDKQLTQNKQDKKAGLKAHGDGFGEMTASQQAQYLKEHPELQQSTGVSASMMEFTAKMQDPAFRKKFDAMNDAEKAKLVMEYQKPSMQLMQKTHSQNGISTAMEAAKLIDEFNKNYKGSSTNIQHDITLKEQELDAQEQEALEPVLAEKQKLLRRVGASMTEAESRRLAEVTAQEWNIRNEAFEKKIKFYRNTVMELIASFKMAAKPFDDFLARIDYGENLKAAKETKELAQIAGYQGNLFNQIATIQDLAKSITLQAAGFYKDKLAAERTK